MAGVGSQQGCPDIDSDGDGVLDGLDQCPKLAGLSAFQGCPPPDADGDGVPDAEDACPKERGLPQNHGCPLKDTDGDGLVDPEDACPNEAGPVELKGCPDRDTDGDGVPDRLDNCKDQKGTPENQGCPASNKQLVVITKDKLVIKEKVFFATGKSAVLKKSFHLLDQVTSVLREHPDIANIRIEGHTDNVGSAERNRSLSQARAESVRAYLVGHGIDAARLKAVGYGPDRPADDNRTASGRENNRRVEFTVDSKAGEDPAP